MSDEHQFWPSFFGFAREAIKPLNLVIYAGIAFILTGIADLPAVMRYAHDIIALLRSCR